MTASPILQIFAAVAGSAWTAAAAAGAITVSPTRIELSVRHPIATLAVSNESENLVTMQLERMAWTQPDSEDVYTESAAIIATPSVFELAPHSSQVLRVALREGAAPNTEHAFRLYACEVPSGSTLTGAGLQMSLRIGVPVFAERIDSSAHLDATIFQNGSASTLRLRNTGNRFTRVLSFQLLDATDSVLGRSSNTAYVLAGGQRQWPLDTAGIALRAGERLRLSMITEAGPQTIDARLNP